MKPARDARTWLLRPGWWLDDPHQLPEDECHGEGVGQRCDPKKWTIFDDKMDVKKKKTSIGKKEETSALWFQVWKLKKLETFRLDTCKSKIVVFVYKQPCQCFRAIRAIALQKAAEKTVNHLKWFSPSTKKNSERHAQSLIQRAGSFCFDNGKVEQKTARVVFLVTIFFAASMALSFPKKEPCDTFAAQLPLEPLDEPHVFLNINRVRWCHSQIIHWLANLLTRGWTLKRLYATLVNPTICLIKWKSMLTFL